MLAVNWHKSIGVGLVVGGIIVAAIATASVALARLQLREFLSK